MATSPKYATNQSRSGIASVKGKKEYLTFCLAHGHIISLMHIDEKAKGIQPYKKHTTWNAKSKIK